MNAALGLRALTIDRRQVPLARRVALASLVGRLTTDLRAEARLAGEEVIVLSTCERYEVYDASDGITVPAVLHSAPIGESRPMARHGVDAARHLFRVASGLESRLRGEPHVLGQVREALVEAARYGSPRGVAADTFASAIRCGRRVRADARFGMPWASYAARATERLRSELGDLGASHIGIVGSGALARETAQRLREAGVGRLTIIARDETRRRALALALGAAHLPLDALAVAAGRLNAIVTAVSATGPVVTADALAMCGAALFVDLGAAPNVDPVVDMMPGVRVVRLDDLGATDVGSADLERATATVERALARFLAGRTPAVQGDWRSRPRKAS